MDNKLTFADTSLEVEWDKTSSIIEVIKNHPTLKGEATHIKGEVFFYQYDLDIPFDGSEREVFDIGDVVYWRSQKEVNKFGILFMYGNTEYGDGTKSRTSSPGIKIGTIKEHKKFSTIITGTLLQLGL